MKINQETRVDVESLRKEASVNAQPSVRFGQVLAQQDYRLQTEQVTRLLEDIQLAGDRLANSRNMRDFAKFKSLVKRFLKEAVEQGLDLKQSHTWDRYGEGKRLKTVEVIDQQLLELTADLLDKEKSSVDLLSKIGEVKGLLMNLYI